MKRTGRGLSAGRLIAAALLSLWTIGCGDEGETYTVPLPSQIEAPSEILFSASDMSAGATWAESSILMAPGGATRIGMLVDLHDPQQMAALQGRIEVRGFGQDGQPTEWQPAELTWSEEVYLVARADAGITIHAAQLRVPSELLETIANVTLSAVVPENETQGEIHFGTQESPLTVSEVVKPRSAWKARATKCSSQDSTKSRMAIHHTYTPPASSGSFEARLRAIQAYHMDTRGWCDVGYHFLVTQDGTVWEGRPLKYIGAHVGGHNTGNVGISFVGCFQTGACDSMGTMVPSAASLQAAANVVSALSDQYGITKDTAHVKGHTQHAGASTSCPGDNLLGRIGDILALASGDTPSGGTDEPAPEGGKGRVMGVVWDTSTGNSPSALGAKRIDNAFITIEGGPNVSVTASTAYWETDLETGSWTITASAPGYQSATRTVSVGVGASHWASIGLAPAGAEPQDGPATIHVFSADGKALDQSVLYVPGKGSLLTDAAGTLTVDLDGNASIQAWAVGYQSAVRVVGPGETATITLSPEAKVSGTGVVQGVIWDAAETAGPSDIGAVRLPGTIVVCSCGLAREARAEDAFWSFNAPAGSQSFTAVAPGYLNITKTVQVSAGGSEWASIGLVAPGESTADGSEPPIETPVEPPPAPTVAETCYPGANMAWDVCFPLVPRAELAESGYAHPTGAPSSAQYTQPTHFLDLQAVNPDTKLAPNFALDELMQASKGRYGVYSPRAVAHWQAIRNALGVPLSVNSGYRSPSYNAGISGSATFSRHTYGDGADVTANGKVALTTISNACYSNGADYVQLYTTHVHCDWRDDPLDEGFWAGLTGASKPGVYHEGAKRGEAWVDRPAHTPRVGDAVLLSARWDGFDEGVPWVTWIVEGPGVDLILEPSPHLAFEVPERGEYIVRWEVGGHLSGAMVLTAE